MMSIDMRKNLIEKNSKVSICKQCELLGLSRSTLYYTPLKVQNDRDLQMMEALDELHLEDPTRGTRRMRDELRKKGFNVGRCHVRTLMKIMRLKTVYCKPRTTIIDPDKYKYPYLLRGLNITRPNQVWGIDITYIPMQRGFMYMTAIIDHYSRYIVHWSLSNTMDTNWVVNTVKTAMQKHGHPEIINSDQGSQFTSDLYVEFLKDQEIKISMDGKGRALDNVYIERFWRTLKYDRLYLVKPESGMELSHVCEEFINYYNMRRDHSSIGKVPPIVEYKRAA